MDSISSIDVRPYLEKLAGFMEAEGYAGYDPYDGLNSPLAGLFGLGGKYGRIAWTQFMRRFPVNLRPVVGIKKGHNPKALGLFLWGYARIFENTQNPVCVEKIEHLASLLYGLRSDGIHGNGWGYNFDWQSRAFYIPAYTPTVVNSAFIGHALLDGYRATGRQHLLDLALPVADFILNDLKRTVEGDGFCFSYTPLDRTAVHNANLLGASLLIRLHAAGGDAALKDAALAALAYSMGHQREDGAWYYAEADYQRWIDSFHTGFNLQAIKYFMECGCGEGCRGPFERGVRFYADNFFLEDGTPKYYHDRVYPVDIHCCAQAVAFFSRMGAEYRELADRVLQWMLDHLWGERGCFYFRVNRLFANRICYMRWGQAWGFHALAEYLCAGGACVQGAA